MTGPTDAVLAAEPLIADPSNAGQVGAWDGNEGAFWTAASRALRRDPRELSRPVPRRRRHSTKATACSTWVAAPDKPPATSHESP